MSWTVHEDEYRTIEPNAEEILQQVVEEDEEPNNKTAGKYTKSSQVFATPTPLTLAELSTPAKDASENVNKWVHSQPSTNMPFSVPSGENSSYSNGHAPRAVVGVTNKYGRYQVNPSTPYDRQQKAMGSNGPSITTNGATETYSISPTVGRRGLQSPHYDMATPPGQRKLRMGGPTEEVGHQLDAAASPFAGWNNSLSGKYQQPNPAPNPFTNVCAESIQGKVYETAKDQHGCRFLQKWLDANCDPEAVNIIMNEIIPHVDELMTDQYANFLVQKLFDMMPDDVRYNVALVAAPSISLIALTPHGTFSVQKMIETISTREEMEIVREALSRDVVRLVKDAHGNHVIQKVLQRFDYPDKEFIYRAVANDCVAIAKNKQGCCVLQRCLEYASPVQKSTLVDHILSCCLQIVQDPFGNYVLQYVLDAHDSKINDTIALAFLPHLVHLCMNKFSSNVMEKVLRGASNHVQEMYVDTICNPEIVTRLIQDDFGNYVLQTALSISTPAQAETLVATMRPLLHLIKNAPYAKKLEGKMDALLRKNAAGNGGATEGHRGSQVDFDMMGRHDAGPSKFERGGYAHHRFHPDPRAASWQASS